MRKIFTSKSAKNDEMQLLQLQDSDGETLFEIILSRHDRRDRNEESFTVAALELEVMSPQRSPAKSNLAGHS